MFIQKRHWYQRAYTRSSHTHVLMLMSFLIKRIPFWKCGCRFNTQSFSAQSNFLPSWFVTIGTNCFPISIVFALSYLSLWRTTRSYPHLELLHQKCSIKKLLLKIFLWKHLSWSLFLIKLQTFRAVFLWILQIF